LLFLCFFLICSVCIITDSSLVILKLQLSSSKYSLTYFLCFICCLPGMLGLIHKLSKCIVSAVCFSLTKYDLHMNFCKESVHSISYANGYYVAWIWSLNESQFKNVFDRIHSSLYSYFPFFSANVILALVIWNTFTIALRELFIHSLFIWFTSNYVKSATVWDGLAMWTHLQFEHVWMRQKSDTLL